MTRRSESGDRTPSDRRHVGLTLPGALRTPMREAAAALDWSVGDWVLAAAAEFGPALREHLGAVEVRKRPTVHLATFCALYLTAEEREELDEQARQLGLNRSAFVTAVVALALGTPADDVLRGLQDGR